MSYAVYYLQVIYLQLTCSLIYSRVQNPSIWTVGTLGSKDKGP